MTAITCKAKRRSHDFYPTPSWATKKLLDLHREINGVILECCSGQNDIAKAVINGIGDGWVITNDIDPSTPADFHLDMTNAEKWDGLLEAVELSGDRRPEWIISNPPFSQASQILPLAYENAIDGVAFLLRLSYLEPCLDRAQWLAEHPVSHLIVLPRISFTGDGKTDSVTCAWMVWDKWRTEQKITIVPPQK